MELGLKGKTALVTGSTKGIGKAIANELAKEGTNVIVNGRKLEVVQQVVAELKKKFPETTPQAAAYDLSQDSQRQKLFKAFPQVDILVNNMGIFKPMNYFDISEETWQKFIDVKFYLPKMLAENFGRIIFIASEEAVMPQYSLTKTMNLSLAKSLSKLTKGTHVTVNTIMPGSTLTEGVQQMLTDMYKNTELPEAEWESDFMKHHRPLSQIQRLIRPEEVGRFTAFVASPYSSSFSGEALRLDGGLVPTIF
ncbi:SDR family NAD(P)-dependent oxidoreductase [Limosilactobacillus sp. c9Ua_26_M]|uniref:SDR family NAD(P)-dependent oxidoreductase n=1 Tax=Limosilactobacillus urinaemulieris TaxID=2742600 RepID=A0ABR8ZLF5_9LACO|nr:SDR family NAD(P)-dependent oxidoreductase [Limosilactobacillus urinaemulieris]MBD8086145.1 SDR family NAD(P)-dependent oxidoreductase [Limosilactobacillus urinaemulieris]